MQPLEKHYNCGENSIISLYCGDCFPGIAALADRSVSVIVTSPPYNLGISYSAYDDTIPRQEYLEWITEWGSLLPRILNEDGSLFLNIGASPKDPWIPFEVARCLSKHFVLQNTIHWIKAISIDREYLKGAPDRSETLSVGHYKPINSKRFINDCHEFIFHFTLSGNVPLDRKGVGVQYSDKSNIQRWKNAGSDCRCRGNNWYIPYETIRSRNRDRPHPATFPPALAAMCAKLHGLDRIERLMDPFTGIGSAALACYELGINFTGFEIDPDYYDTACKRVQERISNPGLFD